MTNNNYDAIVLDINLPVMNGKEFLKILRSA
jgi:DNA-binding response OmpR family regulator